MEIVVDEPISELHVEVLMGSEGVLVPEMIINHSPESLYLSIRLRSSYFGIFVDDTQLNEKSFETMELICMTLLILIMSGELESIV